MCHAAVHYLAEVLAICGVCLSESRLHRCLSHLLHCTVCGHLPAASVGFHSIASAPQLLVCGEARTLLQLTALCMVSSAQHDSSKKSK